MAEINHSILTRGNFIVEFCLFPLNKPLMPTFFVLELIQSFAKTIYLLVTITLIQAMVPMSLSEAKCGTQDPRLFGFAMMSSLN